MHKYPLKLEKVSFLELTESPTFLQTGFWGAFKAKEGWEAHAFHLFNPEGLRSNLLVLHRTLTAGFSIGYVPHGPMDPWFLTGEDQSEKLGSLARALLPFLPPKILFMRFDLLSGTTVDLQDLPEEAEDSQNPGSLDLPGETFPGPLAKPLVKPLLDIQPPDTVVIPLKGSFEEILARMKKKTRYNLKLAEKKGVEVALGTLEDLPQWYQMYKETAVRDKIALHSYEYYHNLFTLAQTYHPDPPQVHLILARYQGQLLAGNVVLIHGKQGVYLYGASSNEHRNLMATYALQGRGLQLALEAGCESYDLFGIPPRNDPNHPMYGLYRFKVGFGGVIHHRHGAWDYPYLPLMYTGYTLAEKARVWYYKKFRKR